jgi:solute:Na+ symporter, SSS family
MRGVDWFVVGGYMVLTLAIGVYLARRASGSLVDFFVGGRALPWWLAGTSMAATTFSIDTPLYVAGVVGTRGIMGNWEWWGYAVAHVILIYVFARLWRRAEIVTDNELTEIRYGGRPAAVLRAVKGFLFAVVIGSIGIGYAMLAMVKVVDALQVFPSLGMDVGENGKLWAIVAVSALVLLYAGVSGLWGVVATDFFQFFLGMAGAVIVAVVAVNHVGGLDDVVRVAQQHTDFDVLAFTPITYGEGGWLGLVGWSKAAGISALTFFSYVTILWWAFRRSDGGGEFIQRLSAVKTESDAQKAAWFFNIMHYVVRTWPWIIVAIVALAIYPDLEDKELGYPKLMLDFLPPGVLGLVVASLLAAFMSTVSTLINWSASYMTNDLYARFVRPGASQKELVLSARLASVLVTAIGAFAAFHTESIATVYRLILAVGTGPGLVLILRWYWWRVNAWAELSAMLAGFVVGFVTSLEFAGNPFSVADFGARLFITAAASFVIWFPVMLVTRPETDEKLDAFYARVRPGGPGWRRQRERTGQPPAQDLASDTRRVIASLLIIFGLLFGTGGILLLRWGTAISSLVVALAGYLWLRKLGPPDIIPRIGGEGPVEGSPAFRTG